MKNPTHPTVDELREWASDSASVEPIQEWDLILSWLSYEDVYAELASTKTCPKAGYFLALLYFIVGDSVRTDYRNRSRDDLESLIKKLAARHPDYVVQQWAKRSRLLLHNPETFEYSSWCSGGFAVE